MSLGSRADIDAVLRHLVEQAVEREVVTTLAPIRDKVLLIDGYYRELNTTAAKHSHRLDGLEAIVRGNTELGLAGLSNRLDAAVAIQQIMIKRLDEAEQATKAQRAKLDNYFTAGKWLAGILITLGVIDNDKLGTVFVQILTALRGML